jgi:putative membrane protein
MHAGKQFSFIEVAVWTRFDLLFLLIISAIPTTLYALLGWKFLAIPWLPIALLGTAVAFVVGFKNNASYERMWEARKAWGGITNTSRSWGIMVKDFITSKHASGNFTDEEIRKFQLQLIHRHYAWITALRFQLREPRAWEAIYTKQNQEYKNKYFKVEEQEGDLKTELLKYLPAEEVDVIMSKTNKAAYIISMQSEQLKHLFMHKGLIEDFRHMELEKILVEFYNQQGVCERIKNSPYPRQFATLNKYFIKLFILLLPFGMLQEFDKLSTETGECLIWLAIPFSTLSAWIFTTLEKIGSATESPFEGSANDVPITTISRSIEIDLREMFNDPPVPSPVQKQHNLLL